ncbi:hypothetical protein [Kingella negevensis]|uniref:hypothetical protein n=1 Tax=Kingella negevensis TaxID=1522312 RepID=UPI000ABD716E|nr:hypothetical protein [Kingella negevensis]MDK4680730.1 hypothetical protein [Kingella negevensis]MDK4681547.1 hypothetical protein [Kingella negevensis]MDK4683629.1 hypothetical protein [Kingella negevensis]MDK4687801.1 hypothetical protein [Kingella negevensis]MDK4691934.1 hypothetical protein [Kingella negevensis]
MKQPLMMPLFLIIVGTLWFLNSVNLFPSTADIVAFTLMAVGALVLIFDGINKQSIVSAPLLAYIGGAIYIVNNYDYPTSPVFALGMIFTGCLMLLARSDLVPAKRSRRLPPQ